MWHRIAQLLIKEFLQLKRDRSARFRLLIPPIIQMLLFGYAATFEVFNVSTAILDQDHSPESRALIAAVVHSSRFEMTTAAQTRKEAEAAVESSDAQLAIIVPAGFTEQLRKGQSAPVQVHADGTNSNSALVALGYFSEIAMTFGQGFALDLAERTG
jgi:ABC-2 type transport system permease protein